MNDNKPPKIEGEIVETLPDTKFRVRLDDGRVIIASLAGKMRMNYIRVILGDKVTVEISDNEDKGRIIFRNK